MMVSNDMIRARIDVVAIIIIPYVRSIMTVM
jgi:hypothetical protein